MRPTPATTGDGTAIIFILEQQAVGHIGVSRNAYLKHAASWSHTTLSNSQKPNLLLPLTPHIMLLVYYYQNLNIPLNEIPQNIPQETFLNDISSGGIP
jgi:hypothetical protein